MPTYLDDNGNPISASASPTQKQYLDPNTGDPIKQATPQAQPEGFWHSLGAQFGLTPEAAKAAMQDQKDHPIKSAIMAALGPGGQVAQAVYNQVKQSGGELVQAGKDAISGNTAGVVSHGVKAIPIVGPAIDKAADQYADKNYAGEMGTLTGAAAQAAPIVAGAVDTAAPGRPIIPNPPGVTEIAQAAKSAGAKLVPSLVDGPPESLVTRAVKPGKNNTTWNRDVGQAIPLMKSAEQTLGHPITGIDDALDAAGAAKKAIWQQYQARLGPAATQGATIDGNQIADAMVNSIDKRTATQNPGLVQRVNATADTYRRPMSLSEAEDFLQSANKDLNTYYTKNKVGQQAAMNDPEISSTVSEAGALRDALYSKLDQISGPGAAQLKQAYGSLTNVEKELYGRQLVSARQAPESLSEQLSTVSGAGKIAKGVLTASPGDVIEGAQNIAVSRALKARNSSDAMISRAFEAAQPAQPFPMPTFRPPQTTLLLPSQSGAKTPLMAPDPGMTAGERSAALNQWLRQRQQLALPANSTPIRLPPPQ